MVMVVLILLAALHSAPGAGSTVPSAGQAAADARVPAGISRLVRSFEESEDLSGMAPGATLELLDLPRSDADRKRLWRAVPASGAISDRYLLHMAIVSISTDRAMVDVRTRSTAYQDAPGQSSAAKPRTIHDRIELVRTGAGWRITSVARRIR